MHCAQVEFERYDHVSVALTPDLTAKGTLFLRAAATLFSLKGKLAFERLLHLWVTPHAHAPSRASVFVFLWAPTPTRTLTHTHLPCCLLRAFAFVRFLVSRRS